MEKNKTAKYVKYAIGEIVLVVIGILIALQINNWNDLQKLKKEEQNTLAKLFNESEQIIKYLNAISSKYDDLISMVDKSAQALNKKALQDMSLDEFAFGVYSTAYYEAIAPPKSTFEELNNTGRINNIQSDSVRKRISDYYSELEYINTQLIYFRNQFTNPVETGGKDFVYVYDERSHAKIKPRVNFEQLAQNDLFISKHVKALRDQIVFNETRKRLLELAKKMHQELEKEIENKND